MDAPRVFLAWSGQVEAGAALGKALDIVKSQLNTRGYEVYNWTEQPHNRNINKEVEERIRNSDMLILEGSTDRPNPAFEMGFARFPDLPIIVLKQEESRELPVDYGAPKYLLYPKDVGQESRFTQFRDELDALLGRLEDETFSPGHRQVRRALNSFASVVLDTCNHYNDDHPHLYLVNGLIDAITGDFKAGGPSMIVADAEYYVRMFGALQSRTKIRFRAIADLTDNTEAFWELERPEPLSTPGSERIFVVDWRLFFEREDELAAYLDTWRDHMTTDRDYTIYIVTDSDLDSHLRHPLGRDAVGRHLLLVEPGDVFGGYRHRSNRDMDRQFHMETDVYRYGHAQKYYKAVRARAIKVELGQEFIDVKRAWLTRHQIGFWNREWTDQTERRSTLYFARYDQHIRCWIPSYDMLVSECAAMVAREVLRVRGQTNKPVRLLEVGYGTGSLTAKVGPWISQLGEPFVTFGHLPPVECYHAVDRADQMRSIAGTELFKNGTGSEVKLLRQVAWTEVRADVQYDVVFGSLVAHFMMNGNRPDSVAGFFKECSSRVAFGGSIVLADSFGAADGNIDSAREQWHSWMVNHGLSDENAEEFLRGNHDMLGATTIQELVDAARNEGFELAETRALAGTSLFSVIAFRKVVEIT